tara:strand:+ start:204 stop:656 length:453 start_codon:yes stop_codon:yes gene_type:complete
MVLSLGDKIPLEDLYQTKILEFARDARKFQLLSNYDVRFVSKNPLCGDEVTIDLEVSKDKIITNYGHQVKGCALCEASAGLLSKNIFGFEIYNSDKLKENLTSWLSGETQNFTFSEIENFSPVKNIKNRHKCVLLSFDALSGACLKFKRD